MDPVPQLAALAVEKGIGLHVDCCLGGMLLPFLRDAGFEPRCEYDFSVEGVTSMSVDLHKYGFCAKGVSVVLYHSVELRGWQYAPVPGW